MRTVTIATPLQQYDIQIAPGLRVHTGTALSVIIPACAVMLISDETAFSRYGEEVSRSLTQAGYRVYRHILSPGELSKSMESYQAIMENMARIPFTRSDIIVALGGGVAGDLAGFAAASFLRGIRFVQMPTTLLAMVDASVGGKTGINLAAGKNLCGAFWQPSLVLCDTQVLSSLPPHNMADGWSEIIKYAMLQAPDLLDGITADNFLVNAPSIIERCVRIKGDFIAQDERDRSMRQLLNLGHTIGHAVEKLSGYAITHGHAVAMGMVMITRAAEQAGLCQDGAKPLISLLRRFGLPIDCPYTPAEIALAAVADKKRSGGQITLVIPKTFGHCMLYPINIEKLEFFLSGSQAERGGE